MCHAASPSPIFIRPASRCRSGLGRRFIYSLPAAAAAAAVCSVLLLVAVASLTPPKTNRSLAGAYGILRLRDTSVRPPWLQVVGPGVLGRPTTIN